MIQADEDVGKVAQATPIVVCTSLVPLHFSPHLADLLPLSSAKALELFLASLVDACVKDADARGSKKLTPYGLCVPLASSSRPLTR